MNSKDRTASPGRKGSNPLTRYHNTPQETNNLVNKGMLGNNRPTSEFHPPPPSGILDGGAITGTENKTTLKIHLVDGGFNVVKCSDTTDVKVSPL
jgi:hypothetical protein